MAEPDDVNVDELKRRARRRLVGAVVLALAAAVFVPMLLESDPKPLGEDVSVRIPPVDDGKFVNRLSDKGKIEPPKASAKGEPAKADAPKTEAPKVETPRADAPPSSATKESAPKEVPAKESAAKDPASKESAKEAAPKESAKETSSTAPSTGKNALNDAERKVLSASAKAAPASPAPTKSAPAAAPATASTAVATVPAAAPAPASTAVATVPATATAPAKAEGASGFSVQLAAFADDKGANALSNKLKKAGYPAYTEPLTTSKGTLWRVRVGPFASRDVAATSRDKLKGEGYSGIVAPSN